MKQSALYLVDSCLLTRIAYKKYFSKSNYKVLGDFTNAKECLAAIETMQPDIIITDINLVDINGFEFCKIIKEKYPKIKVIILTAFKDCAKILTSLSYNACAYVIKNGNTDLKKVADIVSQGGFWMDLEISREVFSKIPKQNNVYEYSNLKNNLTSRELEVLKLMTEGKTNSQIAKEIIISINTAKAHVGRILEKLSAKDRVQAVVMALRANLF